VKAKRLAVAMQGYTGRGTSRRSQGRTVLIKCDDVEDASRSFTKFRSLSRYVTENGSTMWDRLFEVGREAGVPGPLRLG
jgi:hypothetical protein